MGEDYGEGSSIMQERSHAFAMKSQMWLLDPRPNLPSIVQAVEKGFELSEASSTPVMLEMRIRACHVHGRFVAKNNVRPKFTLKDAMEHPVRDTSRSGRSSSTGGPGSARSPAPIPSRSLMNFTNGSERHMPAAISKLYARD